MDRLSLKVLKYFSENAQDSIPEKYIIAKFGTLAAKSLSFLDHEGYIKSGRTFVGIDANNKSVFLSDGKFSITSKGLAFLEEKPGHDFDRWLTRIIAIWGAITGTAALVIEVVLHFL